MSLTRDVAVTGVGLITAPGSGADEFWDGLCAARPRVTEDPMLAGLPVSHSCRSSTFEPELTLGGRLSRRLDRFTQLALVAADQALADARLDAAQWQAPRVGVVLGVGSNSIEGYGDQFRHLHAGRPKHVSSLALPRSVPNMAAGEVAMRVNAQGPNFVTSSACASGATAIGVARDLLRSGTCDVVLTGGSETVRTAMTAACFAQLGVLSDGRRGPISCRPFDQDRTGFVLGDGAAVLVLETLEHARRRDARVRAKLCGYGASGDAHHPTSPHPEGRGAEAAVRSALLDAGSDPADIHHVNAHGTGTKVGDLVEASMLGRVFGTVPPLTATKAMTGHCMGASAAIEAAATVLALEHQVVPPVANTSSVDPHIDVDVVLGAPRAVPMQRALTTSFGFGGQNAALVFSV
ncbi:beta-ketoacyl-[acyl-carrier-protein] synthase family protein [Streptomyces sp. SID14478]|uniref:beta-ketoacyl synthase N-terminal-like domain-containing protein n=1 Tax=Streptomyces sp. SID14478 TaxID=2706073 RepID=UPI0013DA402E|nr:beta-ketoacyl-[acyl-carrier-protein] synthase family protein [Streptomyces sp. SID14478]